MLREPAMAQSAWDLIGITVDRLPRLGRTPVRINPGTNPEVVWCDRISPARARILNVPLPESDHRFGDILVHDGEPCGERVVEGRTFSVLEELGVVAPSAFGTFVVHVIAPAEVDADALVDLGDDEHLAIEDWSAHVQIVCPDCSTGRVDHDHARDTEGWRAERRVGIAARDLASVHGALERWRSGGPGRGVDDVAAALAPHVVG
jgi:hypothetical protein